MDDKTHDDLHYLSKIAQDIKFAGEKLCRASERIEQYCTNLTWDSADEEKKSV